MQSFKQAYGVILVLMLLSACGLVQKTSRPEGSAVENSRHLDVGWRQPGSLVAKAYQATYSCPNNFAYHTEHFYSDGAGRVRMDISGEGVTPTVIEVLDLNSNETTRWTESENKFFRQQSQSNDPLVIRCRMGRPENADSLGVRIINGHKCHGWKGGLIETEAWFDDDYGCLVLFSSGNITTTLTSFSDQAPDPSVFQPPQGYIQAPTREPIRRYQQSDRLRIMNDVQRFQH